MNTEEVILAHARWRIKLASYLRSPDGSIDATQLQADNKCELGHWMHGDGAKYSTLPEYVTMKKAHADFHRIAADLVRKADQMQVTNIDTALAAGSEFGHASTAVVQSIKALAQRIS